MDIDGDDKEDSNGKHASLLEAAVMRVVKHPNVVETYDYRHIGGRDHITSMAQINGAVKISETHIIMELCDRGSLADLIDEEVFLKMSPAGAYEHDYAFIVASLREMAHAMAYLHSLGIVHRDLKPKNILFRSDTSDSRGMVSKVTDFGLSQTLNDQLSTYVSERYGGTVTHMPPELLEYGKVYPAGDVYAFALIAWEMYTGRAPFRGLARPQIVVGVVSQAMRPPFPSHTPVWYKEIVE